MIEIQDHSKRTDVETLDNNYELQDNSNTPLESSYVLSNILFCFMNKVIKTGSKRPMHFTDMYKCESSMLFSEDYRNFKKAFIMYKIKDPMLNFQKALVYYNKYNMIRMIVSKILESSCEFMIPLLILWFLEEYALENKDKSI